MLFEETIKLSDRNNLVIGVDLGLNSACSCCVMDAKGTIYGRHFLKLPSETDHLNHYIREILKSCSVTDRLDIEAKVPQCSKRSTCTLADLISLNAVLDNLSVA